MGSGPLAAAVSCLAMPRTRSRTILLAALALLSCACTQLGARRARSPAFDRQDPAPAGGGDERAVRGTPYGSTRARLQFFREDIEFDRLDLDFDNIPDANLYDAERDRFGFRAEFGGSRGGVGGFFQVFGEEFRAPSLIGEEFDLFGVGGGVAGAPAVGRADRVEFVVPLRFAINVAGGSENVGGFDGDLLYGESVFELGFGARAFGAQLSSGFVVNSFGGWYESDDPARHSNDDPTVMTGTNVGAWFEALYKHERVPLMARVRGIVGDVSGVLLSFGFAF